MRLKDWVADRLLVDAKQIAECHVHYNHDGDWSVMVRAKLLDGKLVQRDMKRAELEAEPR